MRVVSVFLQIILFPASFFLISYLLYRFVGKQSPILRRVTAATNFSIAGYIFGGFALFPLYFLFQPVKIDGITYLLGANLVAYWLVSFIVVTPVVIGLCSWLLYFKRIQSEHIYRDALLIGICQVPIGWFFEIVIYVYIRKTIPTIYDYFFGKNFPWIMINWAIGALVPLLVAYLIKTGRFPIRRRKSVSAVTSPLMEREVPE